MREHKESALKDVYSNYENISYRNIVMAPGHLVEKWAKEISEEIPYCKAVILTELQQLIDMERKGPERSGREFYVISKDFAKLSYSSRPVPTKMRSMKAVRLKKCKVCDEVYQTPGNICPKCNSVGIHLGEVIKYSPGMVCQECGEILLEYRSVGSEDSYNSLMPENFANPSTYNSRCYYCNEMLWQPCINNIDRVNLRQKEIHTPWFRVTHYANKAHKATKTVWVHQRYAKRYYELVDEKPLRKKIDPVGSRKISPAWYIKNKLKKRKYFDFAIFDEAHLYKGGGTGQGNAMHSLIKSSKKQLALTGTIAGGVAQDLFYLLYRLAPADMQKKGYRWDDVMKFNEKYGTLEKEFEIYSGNNENVSSNKTCRGKQIGSTKVKPGISPLIFTDFLIDKSVFLDLVDLSKFLPPLNEYVVEVPQNSSNDDIMCAYRGVISHIKSQLRDKGGKSLLGKMLQFSLSYLDKPFGEEKIIHPKFGSTVCSIPQFNEVWEDDFLLPKERKLLQLLKKELGEGRNCVVYAEYTATPETCVSYRLLDIIERHLGVSAVILESASPEPLKREAWIHEQAEKYHRRVIICNPKCVETGLDFCWEKDSVYYTYPTLIFYQMGYSLFTIWQASRRHYRLNQKVECRTYYLCLSGTIQCEVIQIIAEKQVATSAIQGKFSAEGLAAMANGVDLKMRLAAALSDQDFKTENELQAMFDILSKPESTDDKFENLERMPVLLELVGESVLKDMDDSYNRVPDINDILEAIYSEYDFEPKPGKIESLIFLEPVKHESPGNLSSLFDLFTDI